MSLHSTSFFIAVSVFDRTESPMRRFTAENVDSTSALLQIRLGTAEKEAFALAAKLDGKKISE